MPSRFKDAFLLILIAAITLSVFIIAQPQRVTLLPKLSESAR